MPELGNYLEGIPQQQIQKKMFLREVGWLVWASWGEILELRSHGNTQGNQPVLSGSCLIHHTQALHKPAG